LNHFLFFLASVSGSSPDRGPRKEGGAGGAQTCLREPQCWSVAAGA
jgi:hypothetical protein